MYTSLDPVRLLFEFNRTKSTCFENSKTKAVPRTIWVLFLKVKIQMEQ